MIIHPRRPFHTIHGIIIATRRAFPNSVKFRMAHCWRIQPPRIQTQVQESSTWTTHMHQVHTHWILVRPWHLFSIVLSSWLLKSNRLCSFQSDHSFVKCIHEESISTGSRLNHGPCNASTRYWQYYLNVKLQNPIVFHVSSGGDFCAFNNFQNERYAFASSIRSQKS